MLNSRSSLAWHYRLLNKISSYLMAGKLPFLRFEEDVLYDSARRHTGLKDFGDTYFREGLQYLLDSLKTDVNLHFIGQIYVHAIIKLFLSNRLLFIETQKCNASLFQLPLIPPIIIIGLPRTGTTLLHRMLALDPVHRGVPMWELLRPLPLSKPDRRIKLCENDVKMRLKLTPKIDRLHYSRADTPEECILLQGSTFASIFFWTIAPVYSYASWFNSHDHIKAYQEYRSLLHILQSVDPKRRLILKAPSHTGSIPTLLQAIPEALLIQTHRHPVKVCNSLNTLIYSNHAIVSDDLNIKKMAETNILGLKKWANISLNVRATNPNKIYDVQYDQLISDPIDTVRGIYNHFGLIWSDSFEKRLQSYLIENPKDRFGKQDYSSADFGLTDSTIAKHFTEYSERFGFTS